MQFIDLKAQYRGIQADVDRRIKQVLDHGQYILGPEVKVLEEKLAAFVGVRHCIGVSSGTDALLIAMMSLGVGPGDEVITTPFSFFATAEMIVFLGATPVFVDIDPVTYNIDAKKIETAITQKTKAIMPVSLYGQCADMDVINAIAKKHTLPVIEDAAQSFGATYRGKRSCGLSTVGCTSFFPSKPLGGYGDGGACFTNDDALAKALRVTLHHGEAQRYHHVRIGINGRLDTLQAAILLAKLEIFPKEIALRQAAAQFYDAHLQTVCQTPTVMPDNTSVFAQYTIQVQNRDQVQQRLRSHGVPTAVHYATPLHKQEVLCHLGGNFPHAERAAQHVMSLPMHPYLTRADQEKITALFAEIA